MLNGNKPRTGIVSRPTDEEIVQGVRFGRFQVGEHRLLDAPDHPETETGPPGRPRMSFWEAAAWSAAMAALGLLLLILSLQITGGIEFGIVISLVCIGLILWGIRESL